MNRITRVAPTIASLLGVEKFTDASAMDEVTSLAEGGRVDRVLMYNPDAVAWWIFEKYNDMFAADLELDPLVLKMESVMPSVTPVCFASMYSGLMPDGHGIKSYTKPVLSCETIFDALIKAGLKPAICSTGNDSISLIFKERDMDYFIVDTPDQANEKAIELLKENRHDLIVVYNGNYDGEMHGCGPEGEKAIAALEHNIAAYRELYETAKKEWGGRGLKFAAAFATDHGCHEIDGKRGSHGLDMDEDMHVVHMWKMG